MIRVTIAPPESQIMDAIDQIASQMRGCDRFRSKLWFGLLIVKGWKHER